MQGVNTENVTTGVQQYSSPLSIGPDAVELRDIKYPMPDVKSAEVVPIAIDRGLWDYGIGFFDIICGFELGRFWVHSRVWEMSIDASTLTAMFAATGAYLLIAYLLRWLYRENTKKWRYVYAADLDTEYGRTLIAASVDKARIEEIVATVKAVMQWREQALPNTDPPTEEPIQPSSRYETYFRIDGSSVSIPGWQASISDIKYASLMRLSLTNKAPQYGPWFPVFCLALGVLAGFFISSAMFGVLVPVLLLSGGQVERKKGPKKGVPIASYIYIGKVGFTGGEVPALITTDYGFADKFVSSVKEAVRKHKASTGKSARATRPSQGST